MTTQKRVREERDRRQQLYKFETDLNESHRGLGAHKHLEVNSRDLVVTKFIPDEHGLLKPVRRVITAKER